MTNKNKTLKGLREATGDIVKNIIQPADLREIKLRAKQASAAGQPTVEYVFEKIETILNWFGYTLGELDKDEDFSDEDSEDLFILTKADGEVVKNAYITVTWSKFASPVQAPLGQGPSLLRFDVQVDVNEVSPAELQAMLDSALTGGFEPMYPDEDSEPEENEQPINSVDITNLPDTVGEDHVGLSPPITEKTLKYLKGKILDESFDSKKIHSDLANILHKASKHYDSLGLHGQAKEHKQNAERHASIAKTLGGI